MVGGTKGREFEEIFIILDSSQGLEVKKPAKDYDNQTSNQNL
jgi:hypothetical protein